MLLSHAIRAKTKVVCDVVSLLDEDGTLHLCEVCAGRRGGRYGLLCRRYCWGGGASRGVDGAV